LRGMEDLGGISSVVREPSKPVLRR